MNRFLLTLGFVAGLCWTASAIEPAELAKRQCRSVHISHEPMPEQCTAIYVEVTPEKCAPGTYFSACNFNDGYIGIQEHANGKHVVIFSIWDPVAHGDNPNDVPESDRVELLKLGKGVTPRRFGNEGTGGNSMGQYDWKLNKKIKFLVTIAPSKKEGYKVISGYVNNGGKWDLISSWRTHRSEKELSRATSFVEDFKRDYDSAKRVRSAIFGPCFVLTKEGEWKLMKSGRFTADPTPSDAVSAEMLPDKHAFRISTGGNTKTGSFKLWATETLPEDAKATPPGDDVREVLKNTPEENPIPIK